MKKFLVVVLAAFFCLAFALPAIAEIKAGGMITTDFYYFDQSEEAQAGAVPALTTTTYNGLSETQLNLPKPYNRFSVRYNTDDNVLIGYIELRQGGSAMAKSNIDWNYGWLMWQINPNNRLMIGRQTQAYSIGNPELSLGFNDGHNLAGSAAGAPENFQYVGAASVDAIRWYLRFTDNARLEVQILDPRNDNGEVIAAFPGSGPVPGTPNEESVIPEFQAALPLTFGNFYLEPSVLYQKVDYDQVASGNDDSIDRWGLCLLFRWGFGMMTLSGEIEYDQNVMYPALPTTDGVNLKVDDVTSFYAWLNLGIKFGAATLNLAAGMIDADSDGTPGVVGKFEQQKIFYGASLPISVAKGFTIKPEFTYYDFDDSAKVLGVNTDFGSEFLVGVQFQLVF